MNPLQMTVAAVAAHLLFERPLEHLTAADITVEPLTPADRDRLCPEDLRRHCAAELVAATLTGERRFDLVQAFTRADHRCTRSLYAPVVPTPAHQQLALLRVPTARRHRRRVPATRAA